MKQETADIIELTFKHGALFSLLICFNIFAMFMSWLIDGTLWFGAVAVVFLFALWFLNVRMGLKTLRINRETAAMRAELDERDQVNRRRFAETDQVFRDLADAIEIAERNKPNTKE